MARFTPSFKQDYMEYAVMDAICGDYNWDNNK